MSNVSMTKKTILYLLRKYLEFRFDLEVEQNDTLNLTPPYLVLGNHANNWDPLLVNAFIQEPIHYVASDEYFRKLSTRYFLKFAGAIPKKKFMADLATVKEIIKRIREKKVIGIFPEGKRNWDGRTEKIVFSTAKLIKNLKIPVVYATLKGTYLSFPRWAKFSRWGKIKIAYKRIFTPEELKNMSVEEIYQRLNQEFSYDEYLFQAKEMNSYSGKRLAEGLERLLFACPHCHSLGRLKSTFDNFSCLNCGYQVNYNQQGYFDQISNYPLYFTNPAEWNSWQLNHLREVINKLKDEGIFSDGGIRLRKRIKGRLKKLATGSLILNAKGLQFLSNTLSYKFNLNELQGLNIQYNNKLEFYYQGILYRFEFLNNSSAYKYLQGIKILLKKKQEVFYG